MTVSVQHFLIILTEKNLMLLSIIIINVLENLPSIFRLKVHQDNQSSYVAFIVNMKNIKYCFSKFRYLSDSKDCFSGETKELITKYIRPISLIFAPY